MAFSQTQSPIGTNEKGGPVTEVTVLSSFSSDRGMTQAALAYLCTALQRRGIHPKLLDLSGTVTYRDCPSELYCPCTSPAWMNAQSVAQGYWMDSYLPSLEALGDICLFSALFSPDVVFHCRLSHLLKAARPHATTAIGGNALMGLDEDQLRLISSFFDHVLVGHDIDRLLDVVLPGPRCESGNRAIVKCHAAPQFSPDYTSVPLHDFVTVYSGHGCYYGKCNFCDYPARASGSLATRNPQEVADDLHMIHQLRPTVSEIVLTQDCYSKTHIAKTTGAIQKYGGHIPYGLMLRAEPWIGNDTGELLASSGCTDVFIGAEALDDTMLARLNKGVRVEDVVSAIRTLSEYVDVSIGLVLFVPLVKSVALVNQLSVLETLLPYLRSIEPEVLTVVRGSRFSREPERHGIVLNATERVLNDSWCFGLSQDIPWAMADAGEMQIWLEHVGQLERLCSGLVKDEFWNAIDCLK